jgi:hypothetical protein
MSDRLAEARLALDNHRASLSTVVESPSLFDAQAAADEAIARIEDSHRGALLAELDAAIENLAHQVPQFTADDCREHIGQLAAAVDLRVLGGVLRRAANRGLIRADGYAPSRYRHGSPLVVWRSCVHDQSARVLR